MNVLYYSNHCPHSNKIINKLSKSLIKDEFSYISLDTRVIKENKIFVKLRNGDEFEIQESINKVPALSLESYGNRVLFGNEILDFINMKEKESDSNNLEPSPFSFFGGCDNIVSDFYSYVDTPIQEFNSSEGNAGMTQTYSYATIDSNTYMNTPPDTYTPDKISTDENILEKLVETRNKDVPFQVPRT
jgi:glutaredoxin-related protein